MYRYRNLHPRGIESDIFSLRFRHRSTHWRDSILDIVCGRVLGSDGLPDALWPRGCWLERDWFPATDRHIHGTIWCFYRSSHRGIVAIHSDRRPFQPIYRHRPRFVLRCRHPVSEYDERLALAIPAGTIYADAFGDAVDRAPWFGHPVCFRRVQCLQPPCEPDMSRMGGRLCQCFCRVP